MSHGLAPLSPVAEPRKRKASSRRSTSSASSDEEKEDDLEYMGGEQEEREGVIGQDGEDDKEEWVDSQSHPSGLESPGERPYRCTHVGCGKSYTKPSRLAEHERSHTGERPHMCATCSKSYLRESHLQAHVRSHLPVTDRPFACTQVACSKRFWTAQHLNVHIVSVHRGEKTFCCTLEGCQDRFAKHNQLRNHIAEAHFPPGTKPYPCKAEDCHKSFPTNQKLRKHSKVHQGNRYACIEATCTSDPPESTSPRYFPNWTALQAHIRERHPPTCPYSECNGRTFATHRGLKGHLKLHEERRIEATLEDAVGEGERPKKRRRGGEVGRDWACDVDECMKTFKSKKALMTHHNITHLGRRDHLCLHPDCGQTFGYKHLLQRHATRAHPTSLPSTSTVRASLEQVSSTSLSDINWITGSSYTSPAAHRNTRRVLVPCPWPDRFEFSLPDAGEGEATEARTSAEQCAYIFSRAYDLRRHLKAEHGLELGKEEVDGWVQDWREQHPTMN